MTKACMHGALIPGTVDSGDYYIRFLLYFLLLSPVEEPPSLPRANCCIESTSQELRRFDPEGQNQCFTNIDYIERKSIGGTSFADEYPSHKFQACDSESLDVPEFLLTSNAQTDGSTFGSASKSEEIPQLLDPPWFQPTSMMNIISPVSSDDTTWTSPSLEFDFNSPVIETTWSQSGVSQLDKVAWAREDPSFNTANIATMDTVQQPPPQFAPETSLLDGAQQPLRSSAIGIELRTMEDRPPGFSSREWRMIVRPEKCPKCQKGHSHRSELKKHILVHHPELAAEAPILQEAGVAGPQDHRQSLLTPNEPGHRYCGEATLMILRCGIRSIGTLPVPTCGGCLVDIRHEYRSSGSDGPTSANLSGPSRRRCPALPLRTSAADAIPDGVIR
ncbi:predicted protein [Chaetomium globosum CBS 148.51]|uniref:C2H2-type domain-containing protein n=1 Tax=Chaetomium globosum (strain ATCC 6205 / CBS 148.51 / DSM 1962 / NBRC 6347 / NRRL 1970) TaxID=306901 RepID=Q2H1J4_CHAGB|nr:uncharacterized protein CHGG_04352 [Chaetomium globosum CBS 148.51]EAQ87733.1 predicted protein [Chaetomium globosum CBS 148.51]